jgi:hypothetical protein
MEIQIYIGEDLLKVYSLDDKYLESIPGYSLESMYNMRMNSINNLIKEIRTWNAHLFERLNITMYIVHQSKMNNSNFIVEEEKPVRQIPYKAKSKKAS